jgi:hypothetical protein
MNRPAPAFHVDQSRAILVTELSERRRRALRVAACAMLVLGVGGMVGAQFLDGLTQPTPDGPWLEDLLLVAAFLAFPAMGTLVALRRPDNAIGWLLLWVGLQAGVLVLGASYARYALVYREGAFPGATLGAWIEAWGWFPLILVIPTFLLLLFPTGRLHPEDGGRWHGCPEPWWLWAWSPRWSRSAW